MNTEKVFTAFNKDGEEILIYRKDKDTYIDLNSDNNEIYNKDDIDYSSLVKLNKTFDIRKHMLKCYIKRKYKKDREKIVDTKEFLLGLKVIVNNYKNWSTGNNLLDYVKHHTWEYAQDKYDLYKFIETKEVSCFTKINIYKNLYNENIEGWELHNKPEKLHTTDEFKNGKEFIIIKDNLFNLTQKSYLDKKTINEIGYKLRKA